MKPTLPRAITRIVLPGQRVAGFQVRVAWRGGVRGRFFSDRSCGGELAALDAALRWRDATEALLGRPQHG